MRHGKANQTGARAALIASCPHHESAARTLAAFLFFLSRLGIRDSGSPCCTTARACRKESLRVRQQDTSEGQLRQQNRS